MTSLVEVLTGFISKRHFLRFWNKKNKLDNKTAAENIWPQLICISSHSTAPLPNQKTFVQPFSVLTDNTIYSNSYNTLVSCQYFLFGDRSICFNPLLYRVPLELDLNFFISKAVESDKKSACDYHGHCQLFFSELFVLRIFAIDRLLVRYSIDYLVDLQFFFVDKRKKS